jgi:lysozyme
MKTSPLGISLICQFEGFAAKAYRDIAGVWTFGYGTTRVHGAPIKSGDTCTEEQAREYMAEDLVDFEATVESVLQEGQQHQFDALVAMTYNIGISGFLGSTICRKIKSGNIQLVSEANFTVWNKARVRGELVEVSGLTRRRKAEYYLFATGKVKVQF